MLINLTPHVVRLFTWEQVSLGKVDYVALPGVAPLTVKPSGKVVRLEEELQSLAQLEVDGVTLPVTRKCLRGVTGMPRPVAGTKYIVSAMVAKTLSQRSDIFHPGPAVRDAHGVIIGAVGLSRV